MQFLAGSAIMVLLESAQWTFGVLFGVAILVGAGIFIAVRNNLFIKKTLDKLTKKLEDINSAIKNCKDQKKQETLSEEKNTLEQQINNEMAKAYNALKFKSKRLSRFSSYIDKHAEQHKDLFKYLADGKVKNFKELLEYIIGENGAAAPVVQVKQGTPLVQEAQDTQNTQENQVVQTAQQQAQVQQQGTNNQTAKGTTKQVVLSADDVIYRERIQTHTSRTTSQQGQDEGREA